MINITLQYNAGNLIDPCVQIEVDNNYCCAHSMRSLSQFYNLIAAKPLIVNQFIEIVGNIYGESVLVEIIENTNAVKESIRTNPVHLSKTIASTPAVPTVSLPQVFINGR